MYGIVLDHSRIGSLRYGASAHARNLVKVHSPEVIERASLDLWVRQQEANYFLHLHRPGKRRPAAR